MTKDISYQVFDALTYNLYWRGCPPGAEAASVKLAERILVHFLSSLLTKP